MLRCAWLASLLLGGAGAVVAQDSVALNASFGYVNADGSEIIALEAVATPAEIRAAICSGARVSPVSFAREQDQQEGDDGRAVATNFARASGDVFRFLGGNGRANETCYLTADSGLAAAATPVTVRAGRGCDALRLREAALAKGRAVVHCWPLGGTSGGADVLAIQFAVVDTSALASVVVAERDQLLYYDQPATYRGPGGDIWRADDGGTLAPDAFGILFYCRLGTRRVMALTWVGAEGEDSYLLVADSTRTFRTAAQSYRHWAPE